MKFHAKYSMEYHVDMNDRTRETRDDATYAGPPTPLPDSFNNSQVHFHFVSAQTSLRQTATKRI